MLLPPRLVVCLVRPILPPRPLERGREPAHLDPRQPLSEVQCIYQNTPPPLKMKSAERSRTQLFHNYYTVFSLYIAISKSWGQTQKLLTVLNSQIFDRLKLYFFRLFLWIDWLTCPHIFVFYFYLRLGGSSFKPTTGFGGAAPAAGGGLFGSNTQGGTLTTANINLKTIIVFLMTKSGLILVGWLGT